jgi:polysaccharide biosynthesis/export protein
MRKRSQIAGLFLGLTLVLVAPGIVFSQPAHSCVGVPPATQATASPFALAAEDLIEVELAGPDGTKVSERIRKDGTIDLPPLLYKFHAAGKTPTELEEDITAELEKNDLVKHPVVNVNLSAPLRAVTFLGAVTNQSLIPIDRPYHLSEILSRAGGIREGSADYVILTPEKGQPRRLPIQALATGDASQDPCVYPGDRIFSPKAENFYIYGQIKSPNEYPLSSDMTVQMALARGGGLTEAGNEGRITIRRRGMPLNRVDLNTKIEPGDVIQVGESFF